MADWGDFEVLLEERREQAGGRSCERGVLLDVLVMFDFGREEELEGVLGS